MIIPPDGGDRMGDLQSKFLLLIALVFLITAGFLVLIWQQTKRFEKKALLAKQRQKEYEQELRLKLQEEKQAQRKQAASVADGEAESSEAES